MKGFLFDENIPTPLRFAPSLPVAHATALGESRSDGELWIHAAGCGLVIVTKDADFVERAKRAAGPPPWVVHLRFGNMRRAAFDETLGRIWPRIEALLPVHKLISVFPDHIEATADSALPPPP